MKERTTTTRVNCADARTASLDTLRALGYGVAGVYEPMPGRMTIIAAEKTTPHASYHSNITIACDAQRVEVTPAQPALGSHDPRFEEDFITGWEERTGGRARPSLAPGESVAVTRSGRAEAAPPPAGTVEAPATRDATVSRQPADQDRPTVRVDVFSGGDTQQRFGGDLTAAGLLAARVAIVNHTTKSYLISVPLLTLQRAGGEGVAPLAWDEASARLAQSSLGQGWKVYDTLKGELITDQVLPANSSLSGMLLYPAGEYTGVHFLLVDQQTARSERFEGRIPPAR